jgi:dehydrogenase/reductase SDR family protein 1
MAVDCGIELKKHNVTMLSLYPGAVKTELVTQLSADETKTTRFAGKVSKIYLINKILSNEFNLNFKKSVTMREVFEQGESIEYSGKVIVKMASDPNISKYSSKVVISAEYANAYGIRDIDNRVIHSIREVGPILENFILPQPLKFLGRVIPGFVKIPQFILDIMNSKF